MQYNPHAYQLKAIKFCVQRQHAGLFLEPGLGKTSISLAVYKTLKKQHKVKPALVIAPLRPVYLTWPAEIEKWDDFHELKISILHGPKKDEALKKRADIYIINPEGLEWLREKLGGKPFPFDVLFVDESTKFKHTNTKRFKLIKPMLPLFKYRYILTGTPAPNGLMDLFGQMFVMDLGKTLGRYITHYRQKFFFQTGYGGYEWKLQEGAEKAIHKLISPKVIQMSASDYLDMPELIINDIPVNLPPAAMKTYLTMEAALFADLKAGKVRAATASAAAQKCRQIASGGVYDETKNVHHVHDAKTDALADLYDELQGQPLLVLYEFDQDLERILGRFGKDTPYICGGVPMGTVKKYEAAWNRGDLGILVAQTSTVSHGLNLQKCGHHLCFYSLTFNYEDYDQAIKRLWRQGQSKNVTVHRILARSTTDYAVARALQSKQRGQNALFESIKEYWQSKAKP